MIEPDPRALPPAAWNDTAVDYDRDALLHELVARGAALDPAAPALTGAGRDFRHGEVDAASARVAALLHRAGVARGDRVALYAGRSTEAVVALVGVLRAGAAYVPLDVRWPAERVHRLLAGTAPAAVLTDSARLPVLAEVLDRLDRRPAVLCLDADGPDAWRPGHDEDAVRLLWDEVTASDDPLEAAGFNVGGRDGHRFTPAEVGGYRRHVTDLARRLAGPGGHVLEVGFGSGLLLTDLAGWAGRCVGVEPAPAAVARVAAWAREHAPHVELHQGFAHEVDRLVEGPVDLALLSSVVQFFPAGDYLDRALVAAARTVRPGGSVLVADVPAPGPQDAGGLTRVPEEHFAGLCARTAVFASAQVLRRDGAGLAGELAGRYDVVLRVADPAAAGPPPTVRTWADVAATPAAAPAPGTTAGDLAYVIFTSGSTGDPKGVEVEHRSVVNLLDWVNRTFGVGPADRILWVTAFAFDLSVYDLFGVLAAGGSVHVVPDADGADPQRLAELLEAEPVTFWDSAPAALSAVLPFLALREPRGREDLRLAFLSGDWVPLTAAADLAAQFPRAELVALGGATECTVWSNHHRVGRPDPSWPSVPYGRPMQNARYHVLDAELRPCPVGEAGDLYIAGDCVARGYAGDPELTRAKFRPDPWAVRPGDRMYRTGDRARWRPEGLLEFLGRRDDQVKVRGYRVELGEVRAALARCPGVTDAVVLSVPGPDGPELAGFAAGPGAATADLRGHLGRILPPYLVPGRLVGLPVLPVAATGKVDRAALLATLAAAAAPDPAAAAPLDGLVAEAWARVLGTPPASAGTSFFAAGGTSLAAARLAALLAERTGAAVAVRDVFDYPTPRALTDRLAGAAR